MTRNAPPPDADIVVTTSDFVRQFGKWQDRATRSPVYILHRGRPRFVMTSVEMMQQLCAPHAEPNDLAASADEAALLDLVSDIVLILDADLRIVQSSAAARRYFALSPAPGAAIAGLVERGGQAMLDQALRRVLAAGLGETIVIAGPYPARHLSFAILPHPIGIAMVARDVTVLDDLGMLRAQANASALAIATTGRAATARINLRGHIDEMPVGLAAMTGSIDSALIGVRFTSLITRQDRIAVGDAIERVFGEGAPIAIDAGLIIGGQEEALVRIGMAPVRIGSPIEGIALAIVLNPSGGAH